MIKVTEHSFRVAERLQWKLNSLKEVREVKAICFTTKFTTQKAIGYNF